jgi:hypothetical protein
MGERGGVILACERDPGGVFFGRCAEGSIQ